MEAAALIDRETLADPMVQMIPPASRWKEEGPATEVAGPWTT
jgi:hypothetical protein